MSDKEWVKAEALRSLMFFCKEILGFRDINEKTHGDTIKLLEDTAIKRKLIVLPRGSLKSSIGVVGYSLWRLLRDPDLRILIDSELWSNSTTFLREIKAHVKSPMFMDLFGDLEGDVWNDSEIIISTRQKRYKEASLSCGGIGTTLVGQHMDLIIHDDMNSNKNSATPDGCQKVIDHLRYNVSILEPKGEMIVIGTRYSANDLIGWIKETQDHETYEGAA